MCTCAKIAYQLFDDARKSTAPLDTALFVIFFIPSIGAAIFSFGSGMLIRAHIERRDRLHAEEYAKYLKASKSQSIPTQVSKKHRPR